jgi:hypothetical protein
MAMAQQAGGDPAAKQTQTNDSDALMGHQDHSCGLSRLLRPPALA